MHLSTPMSGRFLPQPLVCAAGLLLSLIVPALVFPARSQTPTPTPAANRQAQAALAQAGLASPKVKPEPKKAKEAYKRGLRAEQEGDWQEAHENYGDAIDWDPGEQEYLLRRDVARSHLIQAKVDMAERDAISGRLKDARKELTDAIYLDPSNRVVRDRLTEISALAPDDPQTRPKEMELAGAVKLRYASGTKNFDFRGDTQAAYDEIAKQFGVEVAFDVDLRADAGAVQDGRHGFSDCRAPVGQYDQHVLAAAGAAPVLCYAGHGPEAAGLRRVGGAHGAAAGV